MSYYNEISEGYGELHKEEQLKKIKIIKENLDVRGRVLDIGCGPYFGDFDGFVVGLDNSFELLKKAKLERVCGVMEELPFKDDCFDFVVSVTAIHHASDVEKTLMEVRRVLKSDGNAAITVLKKAEKAKEIDSCIKKLFDVKVIEEEKDFIYLLE